VTNLLSRIVCTFMLVVHDVQVSDQFRRREIRTNGFLGRVREIRARGFRG
jgi:hypothetical protein